VGVHAICGTQNSNASQQYEMTQKRKEISAQKLCAGTVPIQGILKRL